MRTKSSPPIFLKRKLIFREMTMRKFLFLKGLERSARANWGNIACVFMIAMLTSGCAGKYKSYSNVTIQLSPKSESEKDETNDDQKIVCRMIARTGSVIKREVCTTKAEWAKASESARELVGEILRRSSIIGENQGE